MPAKNKHRRADGPLYLAYDLGCWLVDRSCPPSTVSALPGTASATPSSSIQLLTSAKPSSAEPSSSSTIEVIVSSTWVTSTHHASTSTLVGQLTSSIAPSSTPSPKSSDTPTTSSSTEIATTTEEAPSGETTDNCGGIYVSAVNTQDYTTYTTRDPTACAWQCMAGRPGASSIALDYQGEGTCYCYVAPVRESLYTRYRAGDTTYLMFFPLTCWAVNSPTSSAAPPPTSTTVEAASTPTSSPQTCGVYGIVKESAAQNVLSVVTSFVEITQCWQHTMIGGYKSFFWDFDNNGCYLLDTQVENAISPSNSSPYIWYDAGCPWSVAA